MSEIYEAIKEPSANKVLATFYIEAQCGDTTRFVHDQLWPSWQKLYDTNQIIWRVVPFGKAQCYSQPDNDYKCECQHGEDECELNQLMNCVIKHVRRIDHLLDCASGKEGRRLLSEAGELTKQIDLTFVPWIELNGKRSVDAMYALHENLCNLMPNKPKQCFNN
ncbi:unnamed protein product [Anisakis simplex]|uniref:GILT-like protein (inferred by orthology to a C. elegans protein) n=1 Tax=Anisakis simplex TaxID=6269 RepID=A0A0M3K8M4_ANISI|nr:unnamed protein product [Anisakis simplex]